MNKVIIIGGGLWGGLLAYRLKQCRKDVVFEIFEKDQSFGGNHTWSFHESDVSAEALKWITPFIRKSWPGYQVRFPEYTRDIQVPYHTIDSVGFHKILMSHLDPRRIHLNTTKKFQDVSSNDLLVDARGRYENTQCGFQKFYGLEIELDRPHGLSEPVLMDATVGQKDGFRFIYVLPFDERTLLIEDTRYSETSHIDFTDCKKEILNYANKMGWTPGRIIRSEEGSLPIPFYLKPSVPKDFIDLSGSFHDVTGYSLPQAVKTIDLLIRTPLDQWQSVLQNFHKKNESNRDFYCFLNRMMFKAADTDARYKVLQFFYRSREESIRKFYSGELNSWDKILFFAGKPPVSISKAMKVMVQGQKESLCLN